MENSWKKWWWISETDGLGFSIRGTNSRAFMTQMLNKLLQVVPEEALQCKQRAGGRFGIRLIDFRQQQRQRRKLIKHWNWIRTSSHIDRIGDPKKKYGKGYPTKRHHHWKKNLRPGRPENSQRRLVWGFHETRLYALHAKLYRLPLHY